MIKEPDVNELTRFVTEIYDALEVNLVELICSGADAIDLQKINTRFFLLKEKYKAMHVLYWATMLRVTGMFRDKIPDWPKFLEETKQRIDKEFGPEAVKDMLFGMV